jgi:hypothetical protein
MKKICFIFVILVFSQISFAQKNESHLTDASVLKGSWMLGGDLTTSWRSYSIDQGGVKNEDAGRIFRLNGTGKSGYFIMEDLALGLKGSLGYNNTKSDSTGPAPQQVMLLAGPFIRKYLKAGVFGEAGSGFGLNQVGKGNKVDLLSADLGLGYTYFLNHNIALEPQFVVVYSKQKSGPSGRNTYTEIGPEFRFGIQAFLFKPKLATPDNR